MTETQLRRRVEFWQKRLTALGLGQWRFTAIQIVECPHGQDDAIASIEPSQVYDTAVLHIQEDELERMNASELDETIIHELLHLVFRDLDKHVENTVHYQMTAQQHHEWYRVYNFFREQIVERVARTIYAEAMG